jgi:hypothetical protein
MLFRLIDWYLARHGAKRVAATSIMIEIPANVQEIAIAALPLILVQEGKPFRGEYKRRQVYAQLARMFPQEPKVDVSLAVEIAVRMAKGI